MRWFLVIAIVFLGGCSLTPEQKESIGAGVATGFGEAARAAGDALGAAETGGWAAGLTVLALGLARAGVSGWKKSREVLRTARIDEVKEGVKKAK